eukprot:gnl/Chilomastix_cuspidata/1326.p1 GENE.gnl/Chilomastix_cuspidata/1326~~gnl/Chilomastix_cuspidata/1326.p1  ORF type:complete len:413 (-),score=71.02 gnl/Chilomastix_cuspidata/1326:24-1262(-)
MKEPSRVGYIVGMLISGSINTVAKKLQNGTYTYGLDDEEELFNKPWWQTGIMFTGEAIDLAIYAISRSVKNKKSIEQKALLNPLETSSEKERESGGKETETERGSASALENEAQPSQAPTMPLGKFILLGIVLCACDLLATSVQGIGLLYVDASVYQLLRGAVIIFTSIWSIIFLKRRLRSFQWTGIGVVVIGLLCVGLSGFFGSSTENSTASETILGILLIFFSQIFSATQFIIEEKTMKGLSFHPLKIVGLEGVIGVILTEAVVLPILYFIPGDDHGSYENFIDAWVDVSNNAFLACMVVLYCLSIAVFNYCSLTISKTMSSVHRTMFDSCRTMVVWVCQVIIYYSGAVNSHDEHYGEAITLWTILELVGFVFLIAGTVIHNDVKDFGTKLMYFLHIYKEKPPAEEIELE